MGENKLRTVADAIKLLWLGLKLTCCFKPGNFKTPGSNNL